MPAGPEAVRPVALGQTVAGVAVMVGAEPAHAASAKQTVTSLSVGVAAVFVEVREAWYSRYRLPLNCAIEAPEVVKNVAAVPSGPTKLNGPLALLDAATWNLTPVLAGVVAVHDSVDHAGALFTAGLASLSDEMRSPEEAKPALT